ncbi:MAG: NAD(P)-dependent oxidoreductase, partial [Proteobacteria bacterium]|nr:NAD(P)-dependent oxidoreductase [Pseudomonadota bacterium]
MMKVLVLGASGMLGNAMFRVLSESPECEVFGTVRGEGVHRHFGESALHRLVTGVEVESHDSLLRAFAS